MKLAKVSLPVVQKLRGPNFVERMLFGIVCVGFCASNEQEHTLSCAMTCWNKAKQLAGYAPKQLKE